MVMPEFMRTEKAQGRGYEAITLRRNDVLLELLQDYRAGKPVQWPVLPRSLVHRVWSSFVHFGRVRDEQPLDRIFTSMRDNFLRLEIATIVAGHGEEIYTADLLGPHLPEAEFETFCDWLVEDEVDWRVSDYGLDPLLDALALAVEARTPEARLKYLDRALHVTHMRGDLAQAFVEGGRGALTELADLAA